MNALLRSTGKTGQLIYHKNRFLQQNVLCSRKAPKFAPTPRTIPVKDIVSEVEAAIVRLPDDSKDAIRTTTASLLHRARLTPHRNITKAELRALKNLKDDHERVIMKADKGNCFVVMEKMDYDTKMEAVLGDRDTYRPDDKSPFAKIERI